MPKSKFSAERIQLLDTFKGIYDSGSISTAADLLGISQSAASKHLQKLRDWFDDELFTRTATGMEPTSKSVSLIARVDSVLREIDLLQQESNFDPSKLEGAFTIATTSEISECVAGHLLREVGDEAPRLRLTFINLAADYSLRELETGKVDLTISVNWHAPDLLIQRRLFSDHFVCLMRKGNPLAREPLTIDSYAFARHVMVAPLGFERGYIDDFLAQNGARRRIALSVPSFSHLRGDLIDEKHIVTLPSRVALDLESKGDFVVSPLPFNVPSFDYYLFWHRRFNHDKRNAWMREITQKALLKSS